MNQNSPIFEKELRFFKLNPQRKNDNKKNKDKSLQLVKPQLRKLHEVIRQILKDFQYYSKYEKQQLNLSQGQRVLRMNGIKITKQNETFYIEKFITREENILKLNQRFDQKIPERSQTLKLQYSKTETITDPRYFLSLLGYSTKQKNYFQYFELQCYKSPAYGIEIVIYQKWDQTQYILIDSIFNYEGINPVSNILVQKLSDLLSEQHHFNIDAYTLRPKGLKHGVKTDI